jgi:hypothetical protein
MNSKLPLLALLGLCSVAQAQFRFTTNNGAITITGFSGTNRTGLIPSEINGLRVVSIGDEAFRNWMLTNSNLRSVVIPDSVTNIGSGSFRWCTGLTNVSFGSGLLRIGAAAFFNCPGLTRITIPFSVATVGSQAFQDCTGLTNVAFADCNAYIDSSAFAHCSNLVSVTFSNSFAVGTNSQGGPRMVVRGVNQIRHTAFAFCHALTNVVIPASVVYVESQAFAFCTRLASIHVDPANGYLSDADGVLFDKNQTILIEFPAGKSGPYAIPGTVRSIISSAFYGSTSLTGITIPSTITNIPDYAFRSCSSLSEVAIPNSVTHIGGGSFYGCTSLINIFIPSSVTQVWFSAFASCTRLASITVDPANPVYESLDGVLFDKTTSTLVQYPGGRSGGYAIPDGITTVARSAFDTCVNLTSVALPSSVTSLGEFAFHSCTRLTNLTIPDSVTNIGYGAFYGCCQLRSVTLGNNLAILGFQAFLGCTNLSRVTLGSALTSIPYTAFGDCSSLPSITVPASVAEIQSHSFMNCYNLKAVFFQGSAPVIDPDAFYGNSSVVFYYLPGTTGWTATMDGHPAVLWNPQIQAAAETFGVRSNKFGFSITGTDAIPIVIEACTNLTDPVWQPLETALLTGGTHYFGDTNWTARPVRFYRIAPP